MRLQNRTEMGTQDSNGDAEPGSDGDTATFCWGSPSSLHHLPMLVPISSAHSPVLRCSCLLAFVPSLQVATRHR